MSSSIDPTKPTEGTATTESVRDNFAAAKTEIEALQEETSDLAAAITAVMTTIYPIGAIYISTLATNPNTLLGFGTWTSFGDGRVMVSQDAGQAEFDTLEETGGAKTHTLITAEIPSHTHTQDAHTHTQDAHTHTQNAHTHTQNAHNHAVYSNGASTSRASQNGISVANTGFSSPTADATATNQNTTATNQNTTATNQNTTATNQNTGGDGAHNNLQPYIVVKVWKRTA